MLVRGADKNVADNTGKIPSDLIADVKSPDLTRELTRMLGTPGAFDCLMLSTQTRYIKRSPITMIVYCLLFIYVLIVETVFIFPSKY